MNKDLLKYGFKTKVLKLIGEEDVEYLKVIEFKLKGDK